MGKRPLFSRRRPQVEELEPRILYSADLMAALLQADALGQGAEVRSLDSYAAVAPVPASTPAEIRRLEIVFVDDRVPDYQQLIDGIIGGNDGSRDIEVFVIASGTDGIATISDMLSGRSGVDAVHLISHGAEGRVELGSSALTLDALAQRHDQVGGWASAFAADGDLLIYGCDVAAGADGQQLLEGLARLTGTDVAASTNATGAALLGGDWNLEYRYGAIEAALAVSENAAASWSGLLGAVPSGTETRVNTTAAGNQKEASVAMNASGAYVVVWTDQSGLDGNSDGVFAQLYNAAGVAQGSQFRVNTVFANSQRLAAVAMDDAGNFVVSWQSVNQDGSGLGIYAQRYNAAGAAQGAEFRVNATTAGDQVESAVSMDSSGNFTVVWKSDHAFGSKNIYGRMYNAAGTALTGEFLVNTDVTKDQSLPTIGMNGGGAFVVAWKSANTIDGSGTGVIAQLFNAAGVKQGGEFIVNTTSSGNQDKASAAMATDGSFVVTWVSGNNQDGDREGVFAQRFSAAGAKQGGEFQVNTTTLDKQDFPDVAMDGSGNFTITWQSDNQDGNNKGIYAQSYSANGTQVAYEFRVNTTTSGAQQLPSISMRSDGGFVVVWEGNGAVAGQVDNSGIFAQRYLNQNTAPVNVVPGAQAMSAVSPLVFSAANGNAISIRDDSGPSDIRVTLTGANGTVTLGGTTGLGFSVGTGSNDATMTFTGTMANVNTALQGLSFTAAPFFSGAASLQIITNDLGATGAGGALSDTDTIAITVAQAATPYILSGSYLGNGVDNRDITGLGFQPDVVLIKARDDNGTAALRTSDMLGDVTKEMAGGGALKANQIQALMADGFQVGTDNNVNKLAKTYDWIAFKASAGWMTVGSYTGNGVAGNAVTGLGYSPEAVFVMDGLGSEAVMRIAGATNSFNFSNNTGIANTITTLGSDGFSLGTDNRVNGSGRTYYYIAWNELAGSMDVGAYTGNGVDNRDIGSVGFQPEWMMIRADSNSAAVQHFDSQGPSTDSSSFFTGSSFATNRIQALQANGFQVGSGDEVNGNGVAYSYLAFRQQTAPTISAVSPQAIDEDTASGAIAFTIGDDETPPAQLHVRATSSNQSLVPNANVVLGGSGANRTVTLTPLPDQYGVTTITLEVTDGAFIQQRVFTLTVNPVNDAPTLVAPAVVVTEDITEPITGIIFSDVDHAGGQETATFTLAPGDGSIGATSGFGVVVAGTAINRTLTGTLADLNAFIAAGRLTYTTSQDATGTVTMGVSINDLGNVGSPGPLSSGVTNVTINVTPINDAPEITTSGSTLVYIENAAPTPVDAGLLVVDVDNTHLTGATVTISANYANGQDVLAFTNQLGITGNWNAATGVLTLSGTATVANYESALRAVTYFNNSDLPSTLVRTVSFVASDGELSSIAATRTITVAAVNDPPTGNAPASYGATEQTLLVLQGTGLSISDLDAASGSMTLTLSVLSGVLNAAAGTTGAGVAGSGTTSLALTGTLAQINNLLAGNGGATLSYFNASDTPSPTDTLTLSINDNGNTGGAAQTGSAMSTINLTAVNDPPLNAVPGTQIAREGIALVFSSGNTNQISVSDPDAGGAPVRVTLTAALGTITLSTTSNLTFSAGNGLANATMTFTGTLADINAALNGMSFLPTVNVLGATSLTITTNDLGNTGSGGARTDTDVVAITVAGFVVTPTGGLTTGEDGDTDTFSVRLRTQPTADVTIPISSSDSGEGTVSIAELVFTNANWNTAQVVTVTGVDDALFDGDVAYTIITGAATSADTNYNGLNPVDVNAVNVDNDSPGVRVSPTSGLITREAGGVPATFEVALNTQPQAGTTVTISITSSNTAEGTVDKSILTFTSANWNDPQTVTITGVNDFVADGDIGYTIVTAIVAGTGSDPDYDALPVWAVADVSVTNLDDDVVGFMVTPTSGLTTTEAGGQATFTVRLTSQPYDDVTFSIVSSATGEGTVDTIELTFTAANWNDPQTVTITGVQDFINDGDTPYAILTGAGTSGDLAYNGLLVDDVSVTNLQVGNVAPVNSVPPGQTMVEDTALVFSGGTRISVADADAGSNALQVTLSVDQGNLTLSGTTGLVFGSGANGSATMGFTGTLSAINAALDGLRFDPFANFNGTATLQIVTNDLGNTGTGGAQVDTDTVAITVTPVNDAPVGTSKTITLAEDATHTFSAADFGFTDPQDAVGASGANSLLEVKITTLPSLGELRLNGNLFIAGDFVSKTDIDAGLLVFTPVANAFGLPYTSFDFQVRDDGSTPGVDLDPTPRTLTLNVTPVNDAPVITDGPDAVGLTETDAGLVASGLLTVSDVDTTDVVTASVFGLVVTGTSSRVDTAAPDDASLLAMLSLTPTTILSNTQSSATLTWSFNSGGEAFNYLAHGETLILTYTVKATDNGVGTLSDTETVTVTITGSNDAPDITGADTAASRAQTGAQLTASGTLNVVDVDTADTVILSVDSVVIDGSSTFFGANPLGNSDLMVMMAVTGGGGLAADATAGSDFTWTFTSGASGNSAFDFLREGETLVLNYTIRATDNAVSPLSDTQVVTITIIGGNDAPVITNGPDAANLTETDSTITATGTLNVVDTDLNDTVTLTVDSVTSTFAGINPLDDNVLKAMMVVTGDVLLADSPTGSDFTWTFTSGTGGNSAFDFLREGETLVLNYTIKATDNSGAVNDNDTQVVTITITGSNDAPVAVADVNSGDEDTVITGSVAGNDSDIDDGETATLAYSLNTPVAGLTLNADGSYSFDAGNAAYQHLALGATQVVVANYTVTDVHGATDTTTLTITLTGTNDAPVAVADVNSGNEDTVITGSVATNDSDVDDGAILSYSVNAPVAGLTLNADGSYSFDAGNAAYQHLALGATQVVVANYTVTDVHGATDTTTLTITLTGTNDAPVAVADVNSGNEDTVITGSVATNDSDVDDGAILSYSVNAPVAGLTLNADGSYSFDAGNAAYQHLALGATQVVVANYTVTDVHGATDTTTLTITLTGTNDAPVAVADVNSGNEDTVITGSVATNDSDVDDGAILSYSVNTPVAGLTLNADGSYSFDAGNAAYQHLALGATQVVVANYTVTDVHGATDTTTLTITLTGTNDAPVALADVNSGNEDTVITGSVATNDSDVDDGAILSYSVNTPVAGLTLNADGSYSFDAGNAAYQHLALGATQVVVANYTVTDVHGATDTTTLTITLTGTNDAPVAVADVNSGNEDTVITGSVATNDSDVDDGAILSYSVNAPVAGLTLNADGSYSFDAGNAAYQHLALGATQVVVANYTVTDVHGATDTTTLTITLTGTNDAPVVQNVVAAANEDGAGVLGSFNGDDVDSDDTGASLSYAITTTPSEGSVVNNSDGTFTFSPGAAFQNLAPGETRDVTFNYTATDSHGALSNTGTVTVTVTGTNDAPVVQNVVAAANEDGAGVLGSFNGDDVDSDDTGASLSYAITTTPSEGSVVNNNDGTFTFSPGAAFQNLAPGETRDVTFNYTATDSHGAVSNTGTVTVTVTGTNDAPVVQNVVAAANEDGAGVLGSFNGDDVDSDDTGASLSYAITTTPSEGSVVNNNDGTFTFSPGAAFQNLAPGETRDVTFNYTATDSHGALSNTGTVTVTVTGTNDAPVVQNVVAAANEDGAGVLGSFKGDDVDSDDTGASLSYAITTTPSEGSVVNNSDGTFTFSPSAAFQNLAPGETRDVTFNYTATDSHGALSNTGTVTVTVTGTNDAPVITNGPDTANLTETDAALSTSGELTVSDVDTTDVVIASVDGLVVTGTSNRGAPAPSDATLLAMLTLTPTTILDNTQNSATLTWNFNSGTEFFNYLAPGETLILTYTVKATDNAGVPLSDTETVTITITGSNDAPVITNGPDTANLTETDAALSASGELTVSDVDTTDVVIASVDGLVVTGTSNRGAPAPSDATLLAMLTLTPTTILDNTQSSATLTWNFNSGTEFFNYLAPGETLILTYTVKATDNAGVPLSDTETVTITITGSNDAPDITGAQVSASLSETNTTITASGTLNVVDADLLDTVTLGVDSVAINGSSTFAGTNPPDNADLLAMLSVTGGPLTADPTAGSDFTWTFTSGVSGNGAFDFLRQGETLVLNYTIKATDNSGAVNDSDTQVVTITITGSNAAPDITGAQVSASLIETNTTITANGRLNVVDANLADTVTMSVDSVAVDAASTFSLVNLLDIAALQTMMAVTTGALGADPSGGTDFTWTFTSGADGNSAFNFLREGETLVLNYTLKATDDAGTPLSDTQVVTITITGSNDQPTLTITDTLGAVTAGNGAATLSDSGTLSFADLDTNDVVTVSHTPNNDMVWSGGTLTAGQITALVAGFSVDQNSWDYTTSQNLDFLRAGETITFTYNVVATDNSGAGNAASNAQTVTIVITGSNNQPTLAIADTLGAMTEGNGTATLSASRALSFADLDTNDMVTVSHTPNNDTVWSGGTLGTGQIAALLAGFSVDQDSWDYTTSQNLDFLRAGETITFTYDVVATDNSGAGNAASVAQTVTIVITGSNDRPTLTIADRLGEMTEGNGAAILSDSGALSFADLDTNDVVTVSHTPNNDIVWSGGTLSAGQIAALVAGFSVDQNSWNYTTSQDLDFMRAGETITFSYTVVATDNSGAGNAASIPQTVTIVITGSNEAPVLATGTVTMAAQLEDAGLPAGPAGTRVSSLVSATGPGANVSDLDAGARLGIAITAANSDNGSWWYSLDDGGSWSALGAVSDASARLLAADATARLYFQPNPDWNGTLSSALLFRAWDQTSGGVGGLANTSAGGGRSAFSSAAASAALTITSVNDAPRSSDAQVDAQVGSSYVFTRADFRFSDPRDTPANQLAAVFIQTPPQAGRLSVAGVAVVAGQRVSAQDIAAGKLVYTPAQDAAHASVVSFGFRVQDTGGTADGAVDLDPDVRSLRVAMSVPFVPVTDTVVVATPAPAPVSAATPEPKIERSSSASAEPAEEALEEVVPVDLIDPSPKVGSARNIFAANPGNQNQQVLISSGSAGTASPAIVALGEAAVTELLEIMRLAFQRSASPTSGSGGGEDGSLSSPVPGLVLGQIQAPQAEQEEQQTTRFGLSPQVAASVTGVLVSAGFVSWALRAGSLLTTLLISVPAWRSVDPLPILAPEEDKPSWATDKEQEREEAALAGLWSAGTGQDADGTDR